MVRETSDGGRWTLPGGWADVNQTAAENVVKEALEESGFNVEPERLALCASLIAGRSRKPSP
jgi:ADP-ribose pyrophosphatase YjhB (NUDIX family)